MTGNSEHEANSATTSAQDPWLGTVVGERYRIEEWIGQGGMGVVYRGQHLELGKRVAIKRLDARIASDRDSFERFRREAVAASRIESPHVVHVFDWGKAADGSPYLVMELLEGCDLRGLFAREGRLSPEQAAAVMIQVLRALMRTHEAKIIHRDLKPENVFLCRYDADELYVKLLDFGISKRTADEPKLRTVTRRGVILGTASYMSPEQARGDADLDARSDLYSVGAILFEALTGRVPHLGRTYEAILVDICSRDADDVRLHAPLVPEPLALVIARALKRDPKERYPSAKEFLDALIGAVPDVSHRTSDFPRLQATANSASLPRSLHERPALTLRRPLAWVMLGAILLAGLGLLWQQRGTPAAPTAGTPPSAPPKEAPPTTIARTEPIAPSETSTATARTEPLAPIPAGIGSTLVEAPATFPSSGGTSAKATSNASLTSTRVGPTRAVAVPPPVKPTSTDSPGVAPGLKLRRTMP